MRTPVALLSILLTGCASASHPGIQSGPSSTLAVTHGQKVDALPRLVACGVAPNAAVAPDAFLIVPVRFTITPEGVVAPGSAQAVGRIRFWSRPTEEGEAVRRLLSHEETAREWAQRNAQTCTFEPAKRDGQAVAVEVQQTFRYAG